MAFINCTTLTRVKRILGIPLSVSTDDNTLTNMIAGVSHEIETFLGRSLQRTAYTEYHTIQLHGNSIWLNAYPVVTVTSIHVDPFWQWTSDALQSTRYNVTAATGQVFFLDELVGNWRATGWGNETKNAIRTIYTGGIGASTGSLVSLAPAIAMAADLQVCEDFRRRDNPAISRRGGPSGGAHWTDAHRFLPRVQEMLYPHKRLVHGAAR